MFGKIAARLTRYRVYAGSCSLVFINYEFVDRAVALCCIPISWIFTNEVTAHNGGGRRMQFSWFRLRGHEGLSCPKDSSIQDPFGWEGLAARFPSRPKPYPTDL